MKESIRIDTVALGARIRQARLDHNMSQMDLAEACGISVPYVSDIERGRKCFFYRYSTACCSGIADIH